MVQVSHWKLAEMTGEAKRNTTSSKSLYEDGFGMCLICSTNLMLHSCILFRVYISITTMMVVSKPQQRPCIKQVIFLEIPQLFKNN